MKILFGSDVSFEYKDGGITPENASERVSSVKPVFDAADFRMVNLENVLYDSQEGEIIKSGPALRSSRSCVSFLKALGIDTVGLANNHFGDFGDRGMSSTLECLEQNGISYIGAGKNLCTIVDENSLYFFNDQGGGRNLRFGMDVSIVVNDKTYDAKVTAAPDTAPEDASSKAKKYSAVHLTEDSLKQVLEDNKGAAQVVAGWATIQAITVQRDNVLAVPEQAVKKDGQKYYCSILQGEEKYDMPVEVGATAGGYIEILSGLNEGDEVILTDNKNNK